MINEVQLLKNYENFLASLTPTLREKAKLLPGYLKGYGAGVSPEHSRHFGITPSSLGLEGMQKLIFGGQTKIDNSASKKAFVDFSKIMGRESGKMMFEEIKKGLKGVAPTEFKNVFAGMIDEIDVVLKELRGGEYSDIEIEKMSSGLKRGITEAFEKFLKSAEGKETLKEIIMPQEKERTEHAKKAWDKIKEHGIKAFHGITGTLYEVKEEVKKDFEELKEELQDEWREVLGPKLHAVLDGLNKFFHSILKPFANLFRRFLSPIVNRIWYGKGGKPSPGKIPKEMMAGEEGISYTRIAETAIGTSLPAIAVSAIGFLTKNPIAGAFGLMTGMAAIDLYRKSKDPEFAERASKWDSIEASLISLEQETKQEKKLIKDLPKEEDKILREHLGEGSVITSWLEKIVNIIPDFLKKGVPTFLSGEKAQKYGPDLFGATLDFQGDKYQPKLGDEKFFTNPSKLTGMDTSFVERLRGVSQDIGKPLPIVSGYRSTERQAQLYNEYIARGKKGAPVAPPGTSFHEGYAADFEKGWINKTLGAKEALKKAKLFQLSEYGGSVAGEEWHVQPEESRGKNLEQFRIAIAANKEAKKLSTTRDAPTYFGKISQGFKVNIPDAPGGSISYRQNNPGNLKFAEQPGAKLGKDGYAKFDTPELGFQALMNQIEKDKTRDLALGQFATRFYGKNIPGVEKYVKDISTMAEKSLETPIKALSTFDLAKIIAKRESSTTITGSPMDIMPFAASISEAERMKMQTQMSIQTKTLETQQKTNEMIKQQLDKNERMPIESAPTANIVAPTNIASSQGSQQENLMDFSGDLYAQLIALSLSVMNA